jgi:hypothetical protein
MPKTRSVSRVVRHVLAMLLSIISAIWLVLDDLFGFFMRPAFEQLWRLPAVQTAERWTMGLGPYATLVLLIVPLIFTEPAKLVALYLIGDGHEVVGILVLLTAYALGIAVVDRLFLVNRDKLLSIGWVARCHGVLTWAKEALYEQVRQTALWQRLQGRRRDRRRRDV